MMQQKHKRQRGAVLVEAAISVLLLFTLIFGILEFTRAYNVYQTITNAAREGARLSVSPAPGTRTLPSTAAVQAAVQSYLEASSVYGATVTVDQTVTGPPMIGDMPTVYTVVTVTATRESLLLLGGMTLTSEAKMRNETN